MLSVERVGDGTLIRLLVGGEREAGLGVGIGFGVNVETVGYQ